MATQDGKLTLARVDGSADLAARRAVRAACFGFFVDMFDVYLPIAVLAPALTYFIPAGLSGTTQATIFYLVFAITLVGRPLGRRGRWSLRAEHWADTPPPAQSRARP